MLWSWSQARPAPVDTKVSRERPDAPRMSTPYNSEEKTGIAGIVDGINSDEDARAIKADLAGLPGVHSVEVIGSSVRIRFVPGIVTSQQFDYAIKIAGFQSSGFRTTA